MPSTLSREASALCRRATPSGKVLRAYKDAVVQVRPLADGGEGTVEALTIGMGGELQTVTVTGPLGEKAQAQYGILADGVTAIVEMSAAAGITMVPNEKRNPLYTTTYGVGEMICDAIRKGCRHFIVGIGGSATNDGGIGMLQALGYGMLDENGRQVSFGAQGLQELKSITDDKVIPELKDCSFRIACDVTNPLQKLREACRSLQPQGGPGIPRYRRGGRSRLCLPELHKRGARIRYQHRAR